MTDAYQALKSHLDTIEDLKRIENVLTWDQQVNMPPGGADARARQFATIARMAHDLLVGEDTTRLLEAAERQIDGMPYESDEASLVRVVKQDIAEEAKLPSEYVAEFAQVTAQSHLIWAQARANNDFPHFQPALERIVELAIEGAQYLGFPEHPYDALVNRFERGITSSRIQTIFDTHRPRLIALIADILKHSERVSDAVLRQPFDIAHQRAFALDMVRQFGYDMERGHQAEAVHPFCSTFARGDVRITTRLNPNWLNPALFGMMHEAGHAMYEQGVAVALDQTPLGGGTSLAVHESQSRMWENVIGRSRGFWSWALPKLKAHFPDALGSVDLDTFYRAINKVERSFIRVEADEATYNLHIMLRFEIEMGLIGGQIKVADLPQTWNDRFESFFGAAPPTHTLGVLQDIHWSHGLMGYFSTYALGNLLSIQYYNRALQDHPNIPDEIAQGKFDTLLSWLNSNIHVHGRKYTSDELTRRVTGESIQSRDYMAYLETKFGDVYG